MTLDLEAQEGVKPLNAVVYKLDPAILADAIGGFSYVSASEFNHDADQYFKLGQQHQVGREATAALAKLRNLPPTAKARVPEGLEEKLLQALSMGDYSNVNIEGISQLIEALASDSKDTQEMLEKMSYATPEEQLKFCYEQVQKLDEDSYARLKLLHQMHAIDDTTMRKIDQAKEQQDKAQQGTPEWEAAHTNLLKVEVETADGVLKTAPAGSSAAQTASQVKADTQHSEELMEKIQTLKEQAKAKDAQIAANGAALKANSLDQSSTSNDARYAVAAHTGDPVAPKASIPTAPQVMQTSQGIGS